MSSGPQRRQRQILVAGVGNAWLQDDGFGGRVAAALDQRPLPPGVTVLDFGTGAQQQGRDRGDREGPCHAVSVL